MRYAYFDPDTRIVVQWMDTDTTNFGHLPDASALLEITTPEDWHDGDGLNWYVVDGLLTSELPPPVIVPAQEAARARFKRGELLAATDWLGFRQRDQVAQGYSTTLSAEEYGEYLVYRQALRDLPLQAGFPLSIEWPVSPI